MMKNKGLLYILIAVILVVIIIVMILFAGDSKLDIESSDVTDLYAMLGDIQTDKCGGLITYGTGTIKEANLASANKLCKAYYSIVDELEATTVKKTGKGDSGSVICKINDDVTFANIEEEDAKSCSYYEITLDELNTAYKKLYNVDLDESDYVDFSTSSSDICYYVAPDTEDDEESEEEGTYLCGSTENYTYSLTTPATTYRMLSKAIESKDETIVIYDYYLRITDDGTCYGEGSSTEENEKCTKAYDKNPVVDDAFIKKYGTKYAHTFSLDDDGNYYWVKSEPVS